MKYKFEKSKYPIFKIAFFILLFCSLFLFATIAKNNAYLIKIKNYSPILKPITLNIEFTRNINDKIFVCFDEYCKPLEENSLIAKKANLSFINSASFNEEDESFYKTKIKKTFLALPKNAKNLENKIEKIDLYVGDNATHYNFSDIKNLENKKVLINISNEKTPQEYLIYSFENSNNYVGFKNHLAILISSLLYKAKLYTFPYCWLFVAILIFLFNKDAFKYNIKTKGMILSFVVLFAISIISIASYLSPKENTNLLNDYLINDVKNYSKTHSIQVIASKNEIFSNKLKDSNITWHYIDPRHEKINKIEKDKFVKNNEKTIIYFDSNSANIANVSLMNARAKLYSTNHGTIGKLIYD